MGTTRPSGQEKERPLFYSRSGSGIFMRARPLPRWLAFSAVRAIIIFGFQVPEINTQSKGVIPICWAVKRVDVGAARDRAEIR